MTKVRFEKRDNRIVKVLCKGHTGFASNGEDVLCAALSAIIQSTALGILKVLGIKAEYKKNPDKGELSLALPDLSQEISEKAQVLMETMLLSVMDLCEGYPEFIQVEVK